MKKKSMSLLWPGTVKEARAVQETLRKRIRIIPLRKKPLHIASVDAAFDRGRAIAAACLFKYPGGEKIKEAVAVRECRFPYVPGFLSFREGPAVIEALAGLDMKPDLVIFDGQGIAHPRGIGLASHVGVLLDMPSIGCAKSRLVGEYEEPGPERGRRSPLIYNGKAVGAVLRTKTNVRPLFVSPGHRINIEDSAAVILMCSGRYRLPDPQRCADRAAGRAKKCRIK